jgi:hypothetical protein
LFFLRLYNFMSLMSKLENLQKKPESIRRRVLLVSVAVIMFFVVVIWVTTFKISTRETRGASIDFTPFKILKSLVKDGINLTVAGAKEAFDQIMKLKNEQGE